MTDGVREPDDDGSDGSGVVAVVGDWVVNRSGFVVVAFLVATVALGSGVAEIDTETGLEQFTEDVPEFDAFDRSQSEFVAGEGSTQLIQTDRNVLSRDGLLRMLEAQERMKDRGGLRVDETVSPARMVARNLDPTAEGIEEEIEAVERAPDRRIALAVEAADERNVRFSRLLSEDFSRERATATASITLVEHDVPVEDEDDPAMVRIQEETRAVVDGVPGDIRVFGQGIVLDEFERIIFDSLVIVIPASAAVILLLLLLAYRDPFDFALGLVALTMTVLWTFGFMGYAGIPFDQMLIAVPPLLLAIGIDFGIHSINRYREERVKGASVGDAMTVTNDQLLVAYFIIAVTTVIGLAANTTSELGPIREFGVVAAVGMVFTLLIFGIFLPAAKVASDRYRERTPLPEFSVEPLGSEDSVLGRVLPLAALPSRPAPVIFIVVVLVATAGAGAYAAGVDTAFDENDFLPPEEQPRYVDHLPESAQPDEYTVTENFNLIQESFAAGEDDTVTVYVRGDLTAEFALAEIDRAGDNPPDAVVREGREAQSDDIVLAVEEYARLSPRFGQMVENRDLTGDGLPDTNLDDIYDELLDSPAADDARGFITEDTRSTRVVYYVRSDAELEEIKQDAERLADRIDRRPNFDATATGQLVLYQSVAELILESAVVSLTTALVLTLVFLVLVYGLLEGRPWIGVVNLLPVVVTVVALVATMRALGIAFNALTATILSINIGLGIDYSVHMTHRYVDEFEETGDARGSLERTLRGTGGALTGTMLTTAAGIGVLFLGITPIIGQFGFLTAVSIFYAYLTALVVLPAGLLVWSKRTG